VYGEGHTLTAGRRLYPEIVAFGFGSGGVLGVDDLLPLCCLGDALDEGLRSEALCHASALVRKLRAAADKVGVRHQLHLFNCLEPSVAASTRQCSSRAQR
jgi:hypothetical protein